MLTGDTQVAKVLARLGGLYGHGALQATEVDHWVTLAGRGFSAAAVAALDAVLVLRAYLVGAGPTLADLAVMAALHDAELGGAANVARWLAAVNALPAVAAATAAASANKVRQRVGVGGVWRLWVGWAWALVWALVWAFCGRGRRRAGVSVSVSVAWRGVA